MMKTIRKTVVLIWALGSLSLFFACDDDDSCPVGTKEVKDLDGNLIDCAVP
jgi:hypothetical protein